MNTLNDFVVCQLEKVWKFAKIEKTIEMRYSLRMGNMQLTVSGNLKLVVERATVCHWGTKSRFAVAKFFTETGKVLVIMRELLSMSYLFVGTRSESEAPFPVLKDLRYMPLKWTFGSKVVDDDGNVSGIVCGFLFSRAPLYVVLVREDLPYSKVRREEQTRTHPPYRNLLLVLFSRRVSLRYCPITNDMRKHPYSSFPARVQLAMFY